MLQASQLMNLNMLEVLRRLGGDLTGACNYLKGVKWMGPSYFW